MEPGGAAGAICLRGRRRPRESGLDWQGMLGIGIKPRRFPKVPPAGWRLFFGEPQGAVLLEAHLTMCQESHPRTRSRARACPQRCPLCHRDSVRLALGTSDSSLPPARHPPPSLSPLLSPAVPFRGDVPIAKAPFYRSEQVPGGPAPHVPIFPGWKRSEQSRAAAGGGESITRQQLPVFPPHRLGAGDGEPLVLARPWEQLPGAREKSRASRGAGTRRGARRGPGGGAGSGMRERDGREGRQRAQGWQRTGLAGSQAPAAASRPARRPHGAGAPHPLDPHPEPLWGPPPVQPLCSSPRDAPAGDSEHPPRPHPGPLSPTAAPSHFPRRWRGPRGC